MSDIWIPQDDDTRLDCIDAALAECEARNKKLREALVVAKQMILMGYDEQDDTRGYKQIIEALKG